MKVCPKCHRQFPDEARFCPKDGLPLAEISDAYLGMTLLGQFEIIELIGQGTMGKVYLARQLSVDRTVAVKVLKKKLASDPQVVRRFHREAKAAARLNHPNIVTIHLVGEMEEDHTPYMVMEYVEGASLEKVCATQGALPVARVLTLAIQIASALAEAHRNGVLHRDLKPDNIAVFEQGTARETAKVLDFGIAKILHSDEEMSQLTKTGTIFGTPAYISPEQASGEHLDHRTDLYSMGVLIFRMATGRLPFEDSSGLEVLVRHIKDRPPRPRELNPSIPPDLEDIILKLLAKNRDDRFPSADALIEALMRLQSGMSGMFQVASLAQPSTQQITTSQIMSSSVLDDAFPRRKRAWLIPVVVLLAFAAVGVGAWWFFLRDDGETMTAPAQTPPKDPPATGVMDPEPPMPPPEAMQPALDPPMNAEPPSVVSCDFSFVGAVSIRQVCQGRTVDVSLAVENVTRGQYILTIFIPGTSLQTLNIKGTPGGTTPKILKRVTPREEADQLEIHFQYFIHKPGGFTCVLENPQLTMKIAFPLTELGAHGGGSRPHPHTNDRSPMTPGMTNEFIPDLPPLPEDPMPPVTMQPVMDTPPAMTMTGNDLPPDPE